MTRKLMSRKLIIYILSIFLIIYLGYLGYLVLKSKTFESLVGGVDYSCADNTKCSSGLCFNAGFAGKGGFCAPPGFSWDKFRAAPQYANDDSLINGVGVADSGWAGAQTMAQKAAAQQAAQQEAAAQAAQQAAAAQAAQQEAAAQAAAAAEAARYNQADGTNVGWNNGKYCTSGKENGGVCFSTKPKGTNVGWGNGKMCDSGSESWGICT